MSKSRSGTDLQSLDEVLAGELMCFHRQFNRIVSKEISSYTLFICRDKVKIERISSKVIQILIGGFLCSTVYCPSIIRFEEALELFCKAKHSYNRGKLRVKSLRRAGLK